MREVEIANPNINGCSEFTHNRQCAFRGYWGAGNVRWPVSDMISMGGYTELRTMGFSPIAGGHTFPDPKGSPEGVGIFEAKEIRGLIQFQFRIA